MLSERTGHATGEERPYAIKRVMLFGEFIVQELCESRGGRPELSVLTSLLASADVKIY